MYPPFDGINTIYLLLDQKPYMFVSRRLDGVSYIELDHKDDDQRSASTEEGRCKTQSCAI